MLIMSTSSIYYAATNVPVRDEAQHASEAFSNLKECVSVFVVICSGVAFVALTVALFSLSEVKVEESYKIPFYVFYTFVSLVFVLSIFLFLVSLFNFCERVYYDIRFDGKVYFVELVKIDDHCWIQFVSPSGESVRLYMTKGEDEACYALDLLRYNKETRSLVNLFLASPLPEQKIDAEKLIDDKYLYSKEYINTRREMP